jgi:hypothetical protein
MPRLPHPLVPRIAAASLAACCLPVVSRAQSVMGRVVDEATRAPLARVDVRTDVPGDTASHVLTGADGVFAIMLPKAGRYRLQLRPSAAPPSLSDSLTVGEGEVVQRELLVAVPADPIYYDFQVDGPMRWHNVGKLPRFPEAQKKRGVTLGQAVLQFVIDTTGLPEPGSVRVRSQSHPEFAETARASLAVQRFVPAERAGRKVRVVVDMPYVFEVRAERVRIRTGASGSEPWPPPPRVR